MFKVGDKVKWNGKDMGNRDIQNAAKIGEIFIIAGIGVHGVIRLETDLVVEHLAYVWTNAFDLVVEERKLLPHGFRVGDRVHYIVDFGREIGQKRHGIVVDDPQQNEIHVFADWNVGGVHPNIGFMPKESVFLDEPAPVEQKEGPMTRFVFCSRGGKYYAKGDFPSLERATIRAKILRARFGTQDIYPFVIVED